MRERLGEAVTDLRFDRDVAMVPSLSPPHAKLAEVRAAYEALIAETFEDNRIRQSFMTRATKRA